jgi:proline iminopeptidase
MIFRPHHIISWLKSTTKFLAPQPLHEEYLQVSTVHRLWYAEYGNPNGAAVLVLHGGPGAGCSLHDLTLFDLTYWRVILLDQRGAGRSLPFTDLKENTTKDLIDDIERLRAHLMIKQWTMFGGSWGSALALAYGEAHPNRVNGFILRGIFLARAEETKQIWRGMSTLFPDAWQEMVNFLPKEEQENLEQSFYQRILNPERHIALPAAKALMKYDLTCAYLTVEPKALQDMLDNEVLILGVATLFSHYASHHFFLQSNQLLDNIDKINHLPLIIVNGRYDVITPPQTAFLLHTKWPGSILHLVDAAGHSALESPIAAALLKATEEMKQSLSSR